MPRNLTFCQKARSNQSARRHVRSAFVRKFFASGCLRSASLSSIKINLLLTARHCMAFTQLFRTLLRRLKNCVLSNSESSVDFKSNGGPKCDCRVLAASISDTRPNRGMNLGSSDKLLVYQRLTVSSVS